MAATEERGSCRWCGTRSGLGAARPGAARTPSPAWVQPHARALTAQPRAARLTASPRREQRATPARLPASTASLRERERHASKGAFAMRARARGCVLAEVRRAVIDVLHRQCGWRRGQRRLLSTLGRVAWRAGHGASLATARAGTGRATARWPFHACATRLRPPRPAASLLPAARRSRLTP